MNNGYLTYDIAPHVEAFSTERNAELPYHAVQANQVHGCKIREVTDALVSREELKGVDALVTNVVGIAISVRTADCIPILLYDPVHWAIAAVHAGWRGTLQRISTKTIEVMHELYGTSACDLKAVIGPGIGPDSYQIGFEVADAFQKAGFPMEQILEDHGEITSESQNSMSGGLHLDLWLTNRLLLEEAGVCKENIHVAGICTYLNNDRFFSARREGVKCGRTINVIKMV